MPEPITPIEIVCGDSQKLACAARNARVASRLAMATEIFRSEAPWAIARILTCARASAPNSLRRDTGRAGHAVADSGEHAHLRRERDALDLAALEFAARRHRAGRVRRVAASASRTTQHIDCSDEPCEIITTDTSALAKRVEDALRRAGHADHARRLRR